MFENILEKLVLNKINNLKQEQKFIQRTFLQFTLIVLRKPLKKYQFFLATIKISFPL